MMIFIGWAIFGGAAGYAMRRWVAVTVAVIAVVGLSFALIPSTATELKVGDSWWNSLAVLAGSFIGSAIADRTQESVHV